VNPLLFAAAGGIAAYFLLRERTAAAATVAPVGAANTPQAGATAIATTVAPAAPGGPLGWLATLMYGPSGAPQPTAPPKAPPQIAVISAPWPAETAAVPKILRPLSGKWGWPVPRWEGRPPVISDGFGSPRPGSVHAGVDIMFARIARDPFKVGSPNGSKSFVMPDAWMALAASDGVLWSAGHTPRGFAVVLDHGTVATFYTHLDTLFVPQTKAPAKGDTTQRIQIKAGQPLGVIGADPQGRERLKHLHFELWMPGPAEAVDPRALMSGWQVFTPSDVALFLGPLTRNAKRKAGEPRPDLVYVTEYYRAWPGERQR
jgi:murein DD-endopeptidase MepM/ murein hydrolase activator NlpD